MICLGIETSCDETGVALCADGRPLLERLGSQADLHALFGGVVPELASREHLRRAGPLLTSLFADAGLTLADVDAVAVARRAGASRQPAGRPVPGQGTVPGLGQATHRGGSFARPSHGRHHRPGRSLSGPGPARLRRTYPDHAPAFAPRRDGARPHPGRRRRRGLRQGGQVAHLPYPVGVYIGCPGADVRTGTGRFSLGPYLDKSEPGISASAVSSTAVARSVAARPHLKAAICPRPGPAIGAAIGRRKLRLACASLNWASPIRSG